MSKTNEGDVSSRMNAQSRDLFQEVLIKNVVKAVPRDTSSAFRRHQFVTSAKSLPRQRIGQDRTTTNNGQTMAAELDVTLPRAFSTPQAPHYPNETAGKLSQQRIRSSRSKAAFHNLRGIQYHGSRMNSYSQPPVISSTRELLCLTPNKLPTPNHGREVHSAAPQVSKPQRQLRRFLEFRANLSPRAQSRSATNTDSAAPQVVSPTPSLTPRSLPMSRPHIHYKHTGRGGVVVTSALQPRPFRRETPKSALKSDHLQQYRAQLKSYLGPHKKDTSFLARRMAPVLRVVPASRVWIRGHSVPQSPPKPPPKSGEGSEEASQKRVRFSDQMGLPLTRNMTPTYRKKHSYILRWLETAGRPAPPLA